MFNPIEMEWKGKPVTIPAHRALGAIAVVETVLTGHEMEMFLQRGTYPAARVAQAFGALLRYAGETVSDDDVYAGLFGDAPMTEKTVGSMAILMRMMIPPSLMNGIQVQPVLAPGEELPGKSKAASKNGSNSSKRITGSSSRKSGARR